MKKLDYNTFKFLIIYYDSNIILEKYICYKVHINYEYFILM